MARYTVLKRRFSDTFNVSSISAETVLASGPAYLCRSVFDATVLGSALSCPTIGDINPPVCS